MIKWGKTSTGKQRWFCKKCNSSEIKKRNDVKLNNQKKLFLKWILEFQSLDKIIKNNYLKVSRKTLSNQFQYFWNHPPKVERVKEKEKVYLLDSKYIQGRKYSVHICTNETRPLFWSFYQGENHQSWNDFISKLPEPDFVVIDGHQGILKAVKHFWPSIKVQRCLFHIIKHVKNKTTNKPKYQATRELKKLVVYDLIEVKTKRQKRRWIKRFKKWERKYDSFLKEKTISSEKTKTGRNKWWYKHKTLRGLRSHIKNALPYLFTYVSYPEIPKTTNYLEGGINKTIDELLSRHRGISLKQKASLITYFLDKKKNEKD